MGDLVRELAVLALASVLERAIFAPDRLGDEPTASVTNAGIAFTS